VKIYALVAVALCWLTPAVASAHAPLVRRAVFSRDGTAAAISLPGFGIAMRSSADTDFFYICDALLDIPPSDAAPVLAFTEGGALLVGSPSGIKGVGPDGCPRSGFGGDLSHARVVALAVHARSPNVVYAVTQGASTELARSDDGGQTWVVRATWPEIDAVSALVLGDTDVDSVYVSQAAPGGRSAVRLSSDGGASFSVFAGDRDRALLDVEDPIGLSGSPRLWAVARSPASAGNRGFEVAYATAPAGPWTSALEVNFFGGFAIDQDGAVWVGDEGGSVYRSEANAATFTDVSPSTAVACLAHAQGFLWGCTPGTPEQPALVQWNDTEGSFDAVVALRDVTNVVRCDPTIQVDKMCAPAWKEWQRDVLMLAPVAPAPAAAGAAGAGEAGSSCSFTARKERGIANEWSCVVGAVVVLRRRRRGFRG
jgi:hypothetical protein